MYCQHLYENISRSTMVISKRNLTLTFECFGIGIKLKSSRNMRIPICASPRLCSILRVLDVSKVNHGELFEN